MPSPNLFTCSRQHSEKCKCKSTRDELCHLTCFSVSLHVLFRALASFQSPKAYMHYWIWLIGDSKLTSDVNVRCPAPFPMSGPRPSEDKEHGRVLNIWITHYLMVMSVFESQRCHGGCAELRMLKSFNKLFLIVLCLFLLESILWRNLNSQEKKPFVP